MDRDHWLAIERLVDLVGAMKINMHKGENRFAALHSSHDQSETSDDHEDETHQSTELMRVENVDTKLLDFPDANFRVRKTPDDKILKEVANTVTTQFRSRSAKKDFYENLGWQILLVNTLLSSAMEGKQLTVRTPTLLEAVRIPKGLYVYDKPDENFSEYANCIAALFSKVESGLTDPKNLTSEIKHNDDRFPMRKRGLNNVMFDDGSSRDYQRNMEHIRTYNSDLHDFIQRCGHYCMRIMQLPQERINECQLHIVHYYPNGGIAPHIDSVHTYRNTIGPIFTFNLDEGTKLFDMLPTLVPRAKPFRLYTTQGQITVMDGEARTLWSHAVPNGSRTHRYTLAFKFPYMFRSPVTYSDYFDEMIPATIPAP